MAGDLSKLLSAEQEPIRPKLGNPELENYLRNLSNWIRRLMGRFTGENIYQTLVDQKGDFALPAVPDKNKDYVLVWDSASQKLAWIETTTECPA